MHKQGLARTTASLLLLLMFGLLSAAPAQAATRTATSSNGNVGLSISYSGTTISKATVVLNGAPVGTVATFYFYGGGGPSLQQAKTCDYPCAYQFNVNHTYASGSTVSGKVVLSGVSQGVASIKL